MIDGVKILIKDCNIQRLLSLPVLDFMGNYSISTGEIKETARAKYHFCTISIYQSGTVKIEGSIHKLYNSLKGIKAPNYKPDNPRYSGYNGNMFTYKNVLFIKDHLTALFDCTPEQMEFINIEFGINTTPDFKPKLFLNGLLYHQNKGFESKKNGNYKQVEHQKYWLKIYNKSRQYGIKAHALRFEIKIKRSEYIKQHLNIKTFSDISPKTLEKAKNLLLDELNKVVYYDYTIKETELNKREQTAILKYQNVNYWLNNLKPNKRDEPRKKLSEIIQNHSDNLKEKIRLNIAKKWVINTQEFETKNEKTRVINTQDFEEQTGVINTQDFETEKKQTRVINTILSIGVNITPDPIENKNKKCLVTGLDISMQKEDSFLLSHTGLKWYFKNDKKEFEKLTKKYLSDKWEKSDFKIQIKELAHNIRNYQNNRKLKQEKLYPKEQYNLFNLQQMIS